MNTELPWAPRHTVHTGFPSLLPSLLSLSPPPPPISTIIFKVMLIQKRKGEQKSNLCFFHSRKNPQGTTASIEAQALGPGDKAKCFHAHSEGRSRRVKEGGELLFACLQSARGNPCLISTLMSIFSLPGPRH